MWQEVTGNIAALRGSENLVTLNLMISNDAIYSTLVVQHVAIVE